MHSYAAVSEALNFTIAAVQNACASSIHAVHYCSWTERFCPDQESKMFVTVHGKEAVNELAQQIGCKAGEAGVERGYGKPALVGNTFGIKDQIKAAGARWNGADKAWTFASWEALEHFLLSIIKK